MWTGGPHPRTSRCNISRACWLWQPRECTLAVPVSHASQHDAASVLCQRHVFEDLTNIVIDVHGRVPSGATCIQMEKHDDVLRSMWPKAEAIPQILPLWYGDGPGPEEYTSASRRAWAEV
eukprot:TRINITY_DN17951_c0_g2_i6.p1 TRINITY_DN17951_c0_g2~~TRINITY_DN17951_c0_g2_i6.p1  ORF type:complete len:120 (-),score=2.96 TRINITY_DN17951_c0_g2_i6:116-475(-)